MKHPDKIFDDFRGKLEWKFTPEKGDGTYYGNTITITAEGTEWINKAGQLVSAMVVQGHPESIRQMAVLMAQIEDKAS